MKNRKGEGTKTVVTKFQSFKGWSILLALVLVALTAGVALAYNSSATGPIFDSTFTKWVISWPPTPPTPEEPVNMVGVVGGAVGRGRYTGEAISVSTVGNITTIHALYHFNGSKHSFTADVIVTQDDLAGTATITGEVTEGWLKGKSVTGEYNVFAICPMETPGNIFGTLCFQGTLHLARGSD